MIALPSVPGSRFQRGWRVSTHPANRKRIVLTAGTYHNRGSIGPLVPDVRSDNGRSEIMPRLNRRTFIKHATGTLLAAGAGGSAMADTSRKQDTTDGNPIPLGGPVFVSPDDPGAWVKAHRDIGYRAAYCPPVRADDTARLQALRDALDEHGVLMAEVGRWCNLMDADPDRRKAHLDNVIDGLAVADQLGARCCVNIAGSFNEEVWYGPHPKNLSKEFFDAAVENARKIIDAVKPKTARFAYEMMGWALPDSPESCLDLAKAVDRKGFGIHLDVCNLINQPRRFYDNTALINACFDKLGPHIVGCHAKDLAWIVEMSIRFQEIPAGTGKIDWTTHLKRLARMNNPPPLMIEHCADEAEYTLARETLLRIGRKAGVRFA